MIPSDPIHSIPPPTPSCCPVSGLPIYSHSSWTYNSPEGDYRLRVSFIGDWIIWLQPQGYVHHRHARKGMALLKDVLFTMRPAPLPFIAIDDYSAITGASLNARRYIVKALRQQPQLQAYIVYGASKRFRLGIELSCYLNIFPFDAAVVRDYEDAVSMALDHTASQDGQFAGETAPLRKVIKPDDVAVGLNRDTAVKPLDTHAAELLAYVGGINLETYGIAPSYRQVSSEHPFRPVYDALAVLRDDMHAILRRHRKARENLEVRQRELAAKQEVLDETHTTLNILLAARQEERQRFEGRIKDRFETLLRPLVEGLESTSLTKRQRLLVGLLKDVIGRIGSIAPCAPGCLQTPFTAKEWMIAYLFSAGQKPREMARTLGISLRTVENHCHRMRGKAGLKGCATTLAEWLRRKGPEGPLSCRR